MAKVYLLGGENTAKRNAKEINSAAFQDAGGAPNVVIFPWAKAAFDKNYSQKTRLFKYFRSLGASSVDFADYSETPENLEQKVQGADLVYITGGLASALIQRLKNKNVGSILRGYSGIIVGRSAGALALCSRCVVTDRNKHEVKLITGLGKVDLFLKVHYKASMDKILVRLSEEEKIYAVPERTALIHENGSLSYMGDTFIFDHGKKLPLGAQETV